MAGVMSCPLNPNGNMPAVQERPRHTHGGDHYQFECELLRRSRRDFKQTRDVGQYAANRGAFLICMAMSGVDRGQVPGGLPHRQSGGDPTDRLRARIGSAGWFWSNDGPPLRSANRNSPPPVNI